MLLEEEEEIRSGALRIYFSANSIILMIVIFIILRCSSQNQPPTPGFRHGEVFSAFPLKNQLRYKRDNYQEPHSQYFLPYHSYIYHSYPNFSQIFRQWDKKRVLRQERWSAQVWLSFNKSPSTRSVSRPPSCFQRKQTSVIIPNIKTQQWITRLSFNLQTSTLKVGPKVFPRNRRGVMLFDLQRGLRCAKDNFLG